MDGVQHLPTIRQELQRRQQEQVQEQPTERSILEEWESCVQLIVQETGMESSEAEVRLAEATRWKAWAIVTSELGRKYIQTVLPTVEQLIQAFQWLQQQQGGPLQLTRDQLVYAIRTYPETYLLTPERNFRRALNVAPREYRDTNNNNNEYDFVQLVKDQPRAMSLTYNCADDGCAAECGSCWVTFRNSS